MASNSRTKRRPGRVVASSVALTMACSVAIAPTALAGSTNEEDVLTPHWLWEGVGNNGLPIEDARAYYQDFAGTGVGMFGWAFDAFDSLLYDQDGTGDWFSYDGDEINMDFAPVSESYVDGGLTTTVGSQSLDFGDGITFDVTMTLEIQGSFARWMFDVESTGIGNVGMLQYDFYGDLGSDNLSIFVPVGANGFVSYQSDVGDYGIDPIIGWLLEPDGAAVLSTSDGSGNVNVNGAGDFVLTVGLVDWDPCSFDAAFDYVEAAVPSFGTSFGTTLNSFYMVNCLELPSPPSQVPGTPLNVLIPIELPSEFDDWYLGWNPDYFAEIGVEFVTLPAGVSGALEEIGGDFFIRLTGTVPAAATSTVEVVVYSTYQWGEPGWPFLSTIVLGATTADTGTTSQTPWIAGAAAALMAVGAGLLAWRRRLD